MKILVTLFILITIIKVNYSKQLSNIITIDGHKDLKKELRTKNNVLVAYVLKDNSAKDWLSILDDAAAVMEGRATILRIVCSNSKKLCKKMKISPSPITIMHYNEGKQNKEFDRQKSAKSVSLFLEDPTGELPWSEDPAASDVTHLLTINQLQSLVTKNLQTPTLIMFYVKWCGYCTKLKPEFAGAASDLRSKAILAGVDVGKPESQGFGETFNITGYPTLFYILNGEIKFKYSGEYTREGIVKWMANPTAAPAKKEEAESEWSDENTDVVFLTKSNFESTLKNSPSVMIMFYAPWCGHCKNMKPAYAEVASKLKHENINGIMAAIDATKEPELAKQFGVKGYPTVKYFGLGEFKFDINERSEEKLLAFMKDPKEPPAPDPEDAPWNSIPSEVFHPQMDEFRPLLKKKKHVLVMYYAPWCGHCKSAKPHFTKAAEAMKENPKVAFVAVDCTVHKELCTAEGVSGYPTLKHYNFGKTGQEYSSEREEEDFVAFMTNPENPKKPGQKRHWKTTPGWENLLLLERGNFAEGVGSKEGVLIMFYAPWCGHCQKMKPDYVNAATRLKTEMPAGAFGAVDATEDQALAEQYGVKGFPTLIYFKPDGTYEHYKGGRSADDMIAFIKDNILEDRAKKQAIEEHRLKAEAEYKKKEAQRIHDEAVAAKTKLEQEAADKQKKEAEEANKRKDEEARKKAEQDAAAKKKMEDEAANKKRKDEEVRIKLEQDAAAKKKMDDEAANKKRKDEETKQAAAKKKKEAEETKAKEEQDRKKSTGVQSLETQAMFTAQVKSARRALVMFYRPSTDANYRSPERKFTKVAQEGRLMSDLLLASVDCDRLGEVCDTEAITSSPMFRFYVAGQFREQYNAKVASDEIAKFVSARSKEEL